MFALYVIAALSKKGGWIFGFGNFGCTFVVLLIRLVSELVRRPVLIIWGRFSDYNGFEVKVRMVVFLGRVLDVVIYGVGGALSSLKIHMSGEVVARIFRAVLENL